jgi:hypothetical protein
MDNEKKTKGSEKPEIRIAEYRHGAWSGEFPTIIVVIVTALAQGVLSSIGGDIWKKLKEYIKKRYKKYEDDRQSKRGTRQPRSRVLSIYFMTYLNDVPVIYYSMPSETGLSLDFDEKELICVEKEIRTLIREGKLNKKKFLGINLLRLGKGPCISIFKEIPSQATMDGPDAFASREEKTIEEIKKLLGK